MSSDGAAKAVWCCSTCGAIYHKDFPRCPNDGGEVVVAETDPILGKAIGRYVIDRLLGEGGMGRVYEAHHATLANKHYAIKVLLGDAGATPSMRKRFAKEAESASRLVHPNVVGVIDYGATEGGLPYIVMDFVDGRSIAEVIDDGPMDVPRALRLVRAICDGLAYAHEAGVVHRDLKPANIMIVATSDGEEVPRIADFGLAQTVDDSDVRLTSTGMAMGTPAYAAPEQMAGKRVDHKADLYALGMTLFEMLSGGELPFKGGPMDVATEKAHRDARPFSEVCPAIPIPPALDELISAMLKRRPDDRIASSADVIAAIDQIVLGLAVDARAATVVDPDHRTPVSAARRRARWVGPALLAAAVAVGGAAWIVTSHRAPAPPAPVVAAEVAPVPAPAPVAIVEPQPPPHAPDVVATPDVASVAKAAPARPHRRDKAHKDLSQAHKPLADEVHLDPMPVTTPPVASPPPAPVVVAPPAPVPAPPPPAPLPVHAAIAAVDVHGSLSAADVRRAVDRALPAIEHCSPAGAQNVVAQLTIGENRRAEGVHASGGSAANCVSSALSSVRTESAPDVGEVEVTVHVKFAEQR